MIIHHLEGSRSARVIWLAEELGVAYTVTRYKRDARRQAPAEYKALHPLGRSPVISVNGHIIAESAAIFEYLLQTYDQGQLAPLPSDARYVAYLQWLHFAEGSLSPHHLVLSVLRAAAVTQGDIWNGMIAVLAKDMAFVESTLAQRPFITGDDFTAADLMMFTALTSANQFAGLFSEKPYIGRYLAKLAERPAHRVAMLFA